MINLAKKNVTSAAMSFGCVTILTNRLLPAPSHIALLGLERSQRCDEGVWSKYEFVFANLFRVYLKIFSEEYPENWVRRTLHVLQ